MVFEEEEEDEDEDEEEEEDDDDDDDESERYEGLSVEGNDLRNKGFLMVEMERCCVC
jgi:hypothetical protein